MSLETLLQNYLDPYLKKTWGELQAVKHLEIAPGKITLHIKLPYPLAHLKAAMAALLQEMITAKFPGYQLELTATWQIDSHLFQPGVQNIPGVKNVIAVASGKGGVGKSTTAVNIAASLKAEGARVGILDADIYGPNQPHMLGVSTRLVTQNGQPISPVLAHGLQSMSIGYLIDPETPMIWRGPMVSSALQQLARDTAWDDLDYLIIDLPPGTGDIQLTLAQKIPLNGVLIVTTPQDIALLDARKGLEMFRKVNVSLLGIVENMSIHVCGQCGHEESIFGNEGASRLAKDYAVELLGNLPLAKQIREQADCGQPVVNAAPESDIAKIYREIARKLAGKIALQPKNYGAKFPKIVVEG
ncbi:MAG TPA: iron-sulfur cluster carrier protein ApbC [Gammaproteobacteria bacterium]|nr:iron-sulfur cluster carrier protein ApbC [Gammaproteobacteria bacterium]